MVLIGGCGSYSSLPSVSFHPIESKPLSVTTKAFYQEIERSFGEVAMKIALATQAAHKEVPVIKFVGVHESLAGIDLIIAQGRSARSLPSQNQIMATIASVEKRLGHKFYPAEENPPPLEGRVVSYKQLMDDLREME